MLGIEAHCIWQAGVKASDFLTACQRFKNIDFLKLAERTVYGYAQKGLIPGIKIGSAWRFRKADIDIWIEEQRQITEKSTSARKRKEAGK